MLPNIIAPSANSLTDIPVTPRILRFITSHLSNVSSSTGSIAPCCPAGTLDRSCRGVARSCQPCLNRAMMGQSPDLLGERRTLSVRQAGGPGRKTKIGDGIFISSVDGPTPPVAVMSEPSLAVVGQGVKRTVLNGVPYDYRAGQYLIVSLDLPVIGQALEASPDEPFAVFTMTLKPAAIAPLLLETVDTARPPAFSGLAISDATPELLDPVVRLLRLLDRPDHLRGLAR